jgi:hypothetical protein
VDKPGSSSAVVLASDPPVECVAGFMLIKRPTIRAMWEFSLADLNELLKIVNTDC